MYDCIIIGRGPAGISCGIYLKRYNLNPFIIAKDDGTLKNVVKIENYFGFDSISGEELIQKGIQQAKRLGIDMVEEEVVSIEMGEHFLVVTNKNTYTAKTIFLAMGKKRAQLQVKNASLFDHKGVSYCATCDGFFYRNKKIGLVGAGAFMENEYEVLSKMSSDVTIFTNGEKLNKPLSCKIVEDKIISLEGNEKIQAVHTEKDVYPIDGLFIALKEQSGLTLAYHLGLEIDGNKNLVTKDFMCNIPGIFAGGDVIGGLPQVSKAVSDGANASVAIKKYLKK